MAKASMVLLALFLGGCVTKSATWHSNVEDELRKNPLAPDQNIRVTDLGNAGRVSCHLIQVRQGEPLHIHRNHDLSVFVYRGKGVMMIGTNELKLVAGDVAYVARGVPHKFVNMTTVPSVAVVMFIPGLLKKDFELITEK